VARAKDELHGEILSRVGADMVVNPEIEMGARIAQSTTFAEIVDHIMLSETYGVSKIQCHLFQGRTLSDLGFGRLGATDHIVLLIQRRQEIIIIPETSQVITGWGCPGHRGT